MSACVFMYAIVCIHTSIVHYFFLDECRVLHIRYSAVWLWNANSGYFPNVNNKQWLPDSLIHCTRPNISIIG